MYEELDEASRRVGPEAVRLAQRLIRIRSPGLDEAQSAAEIQRTLESLGYDLVIRDPAGNVVGVLVGSTAGPTLLLHSHMDPARSGLDDRAGALAAQVFGGHVLDSGLRSFSGSVVVATTVAEHDGSGVGTEHLLRHTLPGLGLSPQIAVLGVPTRLGLCRCAGDPLVADRDDPWVIRARDALQAVGWRHVHVRRWDVSDPTAGDAGSILVGRHGVPTIGFGPGDERSTGQGEESVTVGEIRRAVLGTAALARGILGVSDIGRLAV